jgi:hypothetical protein
VTLAPALSTPVGARALGAPVVVSGLALVALVGAFVLDLVNTSADRDRAMMGWGSVTA